jgi:hypothetical protein
VRPDALEKHCIQAEPILDKSSLASKKTASAHSLLWICRRFSTDAAVLQAFQGSTTSEQQLNLSVRIRISEQQPALHSPPSIVGRQPASVHSFAGSGISTFFL